MFFGVVWLSKQRINSLHLLWIDASLPQGADFIPQEFHRVEWNRGNGFGNLGDVDAQSNARILIWIQTADSTQSNLRLCLRKLTMRKITSGKKEPVRAHKREVEPQRRCFALCWTAHKFESSLKGLAAQVLRERIMLGESIQDNVSETENQDVDLRPRNEKRDAQKPKEHSLLSIRPMPNQISAKDFRMNQGRTTLDYRRGELNPGYSLNLGDENPLMLRECASPYTTSDFAGRVPGGRRSRDCFRFEDPALKALKGNRHLDLTKRHGQKRFTPELGQTGGVERQHSQVFYAELGIGVIERQLELPTDPAEKHRVRELQDSLEENDG
ncbi:hypothetical protein C8R45DRAFT_937735 [Mycena sanguinolenta]|nr:hypothetical protein C8R45DRAFT_937735 [Mycena sanguinolenta]